jgi:hypothetical protein
MYSWKARIERASGTRMIFSWPSGECFEHASRKNFDLAQITASWTVKRFSPAPTRTVMVLS